MTNISCKKGKSRQVYPVKKPDKPQARGRGQDVPLNLYSVGTGFAIAVPEKKNGTGEKMFGSSCGVTVESNNNVNARSSLK